VYCPFHDDRHDTRAVEGFAVCQRCADRVFNELHWLADMYDPLFAALTHRLNIEHAEKVKVSGGKDPMVRGMDLNDDAMELRHQIRQLGYAGLAWLYSRNGDLSGEVDLRDVPRSLQFLARHLHWLLSDAETGKMQHWGTRVVAARVAAEKLVTPQVPRSHVIRVPNVQCAHLAAGQDGRVRECGAGLHTYSADSTVLVCDNNPAHTVSRETAVRKAVTRRAKAGPTRLLFEAVAKGTK
jgi:hypothetical protein